MQKAKLTEVRPPSVVRSAEAREAWLAENADLWDWIYNMGKMPDSVRNLGCKGNASMDKRRSYVETLWGCVKDSERKRFEDLESRRVSAEKETGHEMQNLNASLSGP